MKSELTYLITSMILITFFSCQKQTKRKDLTIWYDQPAAGWMEAIPMGNGRIGTMIYGGILTETIALNEVTLWSGQPDPEQEIACGKEKLAEIRQLFFDGKLIEGNRIASEYLSGRPHSFGSNIPLGDLSIHTGHDPALATNYTRKLSLNNAITNIQYMYDDITFHREYFCSNPDELFIIKWTADQPASISFELETVLLQEADVQIQDTELVFEGDVSFPRQGPGGVAFKGKIRIQQTGGELKAREQAIRVKNADEVVVFVDIRTNYESSQYKQICDKTVRNARNTDYATLKERHIKDYFTLYDRVDLVFDQEDLSGIPTNSRWRNVKEGNTDTGLEELFFHYGRYLLISSSRENSPLPTHLQGIWNDNLACNMGWTCDYHLDINTQQNYWAANVANLHECNIPLFNYIHSLSIHGEKTAGKVYGSPGWVAHTVANVWGYTAPGQGVGWGLFPTASAWIASHLWDHYLYTQDKQFLRQTAYPLLKKAAEFYYDYMIECPHTGYLMTGPSTSPENSFLFEGSEISLSMMPTCDRVLVYENFTSCIRSAEILGIDIEFKEKLEQALSKLPPIPVSPAGTIQEWFVDFKPAHPNHRHSSHLLALFPYNQISLVQTPELAEAARKSLENQLNSEGWEDVEWSRANAINYYARLKQAEPAHQSVVMMLSQFARENLLTISPEGIGGAPYDIFVFDGNQAAIAGMAEMLIQSQEPYIELLPALPDAWHTGSLRGLLTRGGMEVDIKWENKAIVNTRIKATVPYTLQLKVPEELTNKKCKLNGKTIRPEISEGILTIAMQQNDQLEIK